MKTELRDEKSCVQPEVSVSKNEEVGEKMAQEEQNVVLTGSTITVQHEDSVVPMCNDAASENAASATHDIQIHVQRPSPVREVPDSHRKQFSVGTCLDSKGDDPSVWLDNMPEKIAAVATAKESTLDEDSAVMLTSKDDLAMSSLENVSSSVVSKVEEMDVQRVRPVSGPATVTCAERPEFDIVRKSRSVTNGLDEEGEHADFVIRSRGSVGTICSTTPSSSVCQFSRGIGLSATRDSMQRIYSTVSFDRHSLKSPGSSFDVDEAADLSSRSVPGAQKANFSGLRSRHTSGLETPMSTVDTSSVTSMGEAGTLLSKSIILHVIKSITIICTKCYLSVLCFGDGCC